MKPLALTHKVGGIIHIAFESYTYKGETLAVVYVGVNSNKVRKFDAVIYDSLTKNILWHERNFSKLEDLKAAAEKKMFAKYWNIMHGYDLSKVFYMNPEFMEASALLQKELREKDAKK